MISYTPYYQAREVRLGGKRTLGAQGFETVRVIFMCNGQPQTVQINEVLLVPKLRRNLISVSKLTDEEFNIKVGRDEITLIHGRSKLQAKRRNGLYMLHSANIAEGCKADGKKKKRTSLTEMHRTFAHINIVWLKSMLEREGYEVIQDFHS